MTNIKPSTDYAVFLAELKVKIRHARLKTAVTINRELILLYWQIGSEIINQQQKFGWGTGIIDHLSQDLRKEFPEHKGFSERNLRYMRTFAIEYQNLEFVQEVLAQLTWYHNITLLQYIKTPEIRDYYIKKSIQHGWSRNVLVHQIETSLHLREGASTTNFALTLPPVHSDLAHQTLKDPYIFDFLCLTGEVEEREIEQALITHIQKFLLELGVGFAFLGRQYHLVVGDTDFYIDLLFYHTTLHCYVVIELKAHEFRPEYAGKLNFYLSAVDDLIRQDGDNPTIGILLCKQKNEAIAEYALRDLNKPIGVSEYELTKVLSEELQKKLPSIEDLEATLNAVDVEIPADPRVSISIEAHTIKQGEKK